MDYKQLPDISLEQLFEKKIKQPIRAFKLTAKKWAFKNWYKLAFLGCCTFFAFQKDLNFNLNFKAKTAAALETIASPTAQPVALNVSNIETAAAKNKKGSGHFLFGTVFSAKGVPTRVEKPIVMTEKVKKQLAYVKKYADIAQKEMAQYGIPASVTLAQGLIETNAGASSLATKNNNHFGIKCFSKKCSKGHCSNFSDDSHKDFFRTYKNAAESFRSHSELLVGKRYKHLKKLGTTNYKDWAIGLKKAGYATDKNYHNKLISLVENLHLYKYDE